MFKTDWNWFHTCLLTTQYSVPHWDLIERVSILGGVLFHRRWEWNSATFGSGTEKKWGVSFLLGRPVVGIRIRFFSWALRSQEHLSSNMSSCRPFWNWKMMWPSVVCIPKTASEAAQNVVKILQGEIKSWTKCDRISISTLDGHKKWPTSMDSEMQCALAKAIPIALWQAVSNSENHRSEMETACGDLRRRNFRQLNQAGDQKLDMRWHLRFTLDLIEGHQHRWLWKRSQLQRREAFKGCQETGDSWFTSWRKWKDFGGTWNVEASRGWKNTVRDSSRSNKDCQSCLLDTKAEPINVRDNTRCQKARRNWASEPCTVVHNRGMTLNALLHTCSQRVMELLEGGDQGRARIEAGVKRELWWKIQVQGRQPRHILAHVPLLLEQKCLAVQTSGQLACLVFAPCLSHHINRATLLRIMSQAELSIASVPPSLLTPTQAHRPHRRAPIQATPAPQPMAASPILLSKLVRDSCSLQHWGRRAHAVPVYRWQITCFRHARKALRADSPLSSSFNPAHGTLHLAPVMATEHRCLAEAPVLFQQGLRSQPGCGLRARTQKARFSCGNPDLSTNIAYQNGFLKPRTAPICKTFDMFCTTGSRTARLVRAQWQLFCRNADARRPQVQISPLPTPQQKKPRTWPREQPQEREERVLGWRFCGLHWQVPDCAAWMLGEYDVCRE